MAGLSISLEGRANLVADVVNRIEHVGDPHARRKAVQAEALVQLRGLYIELTGNNFCCDAGSSNPK